MNLKKFLLLSLLLGASAFAAPDFGPMKKSTTDFIAVIDALPTEIPKIHDAASAAKVMDSCAAATIAVADSMEDLARKNPELARQTQPPPELAEIMKSFAASNGRFQAIGQQLGGACKPYMNDPAMRSAIERFAQALARIQKVAGS